MDVYQYLQYTCEVCLLAVVSCKYEGERCSHVNFTKAVTDYGLCYTFNNDQELDTSKTGLPASLPYH